MTGGETGHWRDRQECRQTGKKIERQTRSLTETDRRQETQQMSERQTGGQTYKRQRQGG